MSFNNSELNELIEKNDMTFLAKITIKKKLVDHLYISVDRSNLKLFRIESLMKDIQNRLTILPMWNGGLNPDLEHEFIIGFKNTIGIKGVWNNSRIELQLKEEASSK